MNNKNNILKKYIINKYGSISKFLKKEQFSPYHLETVLQKNDIFYEIGVGINICAVLNIDAKRLFCYNEIVEISPANEDKNEIRENPDVKSDLSLDDIIKEKYADLNKENRKKVLDYANYILENGDSDIDIDIDI